MRASGFKAILLLILGATVFHLSAQQNEADRKLLADIRAKAEKGDAQSQYNLGDAFFNGNLGVAKDEAEAVKWFRKAADRNYAPAESYMGFCYALGQGVAKDEVEAVRWYRKAAEQNQVAAQNNLGVCFEKGQGVAKDEAEAAKWYRKAADQNLAGSQNNLGKLYFNGQGVVRDDAEAVTWFRKAADQNYAEAQGNLGICYHTGVGVPKDPVEAVKWFRKAADQNYAVAQFNLACCYDDGDGIVKDDVEAVKWYRKAAEQNYMPAQCNLGFCYQNAEGVPKDYVEAVRWFRKAADQNQAAAQNNLGICYGNGQGVAKDEVEAVRWYRKAAEQNYAQAQYNLSLCYSRGDGVVKDYVEGYKWMLLAAANRYEDAKKLADELEILMTKEQIAEGQKLARSFKSREAPSAGGDNLGAGTMQTRPESSGTGFFITEDGFLITNQHVVKDSTQVRLVSSAGLIAAKVVKVDAANDLALLKTEGQFASLPIASSRTVKLGGTVATVGFPNIGLQGFSPKLAKGEIASLSGAGDDARYFQISVPVQPGNSGGALVDERGNVVGIVAAKLSAVAALDATGALPENVNYAVKSSFLLSFLESVPDVASKLKEPNLKEEKFEDVVKSAQDAAVLVLVY